jgi:hypothetical protein
MPIALLCAKALLTRVINIKKYKIFISFFIRKAV